MGYPNAQSNPAGAIPVWITTSVPPPGNAVKGYEQIDLADNAVHTLTVPAGTVSALITAEGGNARYKFGADPAAGVGMPLWATASINVMAANLSGDENIRFIQMTGSTTAVLSILYFGPLS